MRKTRASLFPVFFFLASSSCALGVSNEVAFPVVLEDASAGVSEAPPGFLPAGPAAVTVSSVALRAGDLILQTGQIGRVPLDVVLSNGSSYRGVVSTLNTPYGVNSSVKWFSSDERVVTVSANGTIAGVGPGTATVKASVTGSADLLAVTVVSNPVGFDAIHDAENAPNGLGTGDFGESGAPDGGENDADAASNDDGLNGNDAAPAIEDPADPSDRFLNGNDTIELLIGENGGYGSAHMPGIIYGAPVATYTDVVSLGGGGEITIELGGYIIADGDGADFTVFENARAGWTEPGFVSVSEDGEDYVGFPCDAGLGYAGCAGLTETTYSNNETDYVDPSVSGGDAYDLADVGLQTAKFIRIVDANDCDNPLVCVPDKVGFDLDAVVIVNGVNEPE